MSDLLPASENSAGNGAIVAKYALALLLLLPGMASGLILVFFTVYWMMSGFELSVEDRNNTIFFSLLALAIVVISAALTGIVLRHIDTPRARKLSFALSATVLVMVLLATAILQSTFDPTDFGNWFLLMVMAGACLVTGALPPMLHARKGST